MHTRQRDETENDRDISSVVETLATRGETFSTNRPPQIKEILLFPRSRIFHGHHSRDQIIAVSRIFRSDEGLMPLGHLYIQPVSNCRPAGPPQAVKFVS
jgi:hypothetical protein